jgi:hypothetical protein
VRREQLHRLLLWAEHHVMVDACAGLYRSRTSAQDEGGDKQRSPDHGYRHGCRGSGNAQGARHHTHRALSNVYMISLDLCLLQTSDELGFGQTKLVKLEPAAIVNCEELAD